MTAEGAFPKYTKGFTILSSDSSKTITSFEGKKGIIKVDTSINTDGIYPISKDGTVIGAVVVVATMKNADLEKIRTDYLGG